MHECNEERTHIHTHTRTENFVEEYPRAFSGREAWQIQAIEEKKAYIQCMLDRRRDASPAEREKSEWFLAQVFSDRLVVGHRAPDAISVFVRWGVATSTGDKRHHQATTVWLRTHTE